MLYKFFLVKIFVCNCNLKIKLTVTDINLFNKLKINVTIISVEW